MPERGGARRPTALQGIQRLSLDEMLSRRDSDHTAQSQRWIQGSVGLMTSPPRYLPIRGEWEDFDTAVG